MNAEVPVKRGRKSADGTRAPLTIEEAMQNEILRADIKYVSTSFWPPDSRKPYKESEFINRHGLTRVRASAVIRREPRNDLERAARRIIDPHRTQGGGRGENRGGRDRQAAELAAHLMKDGTRPADAIKQAVALMAEVDIHADVGNVARELRRTNPKHTATVEDV